MTHGRLSRTLLLVAVAVALVGCDSSSEPSAETICDLPGDVVTDAVGGAAVDEEVYDDDGFPVASDKEDIDCVIEVEGAPDSLTITGLSRTQGWINDYLEENGVREYPRHLQVNGIPVGYRESDDGSFQALSGCGQVLVIVRGPVLDDATTEDRQTLVRESVDAAGCARPSGTPRVPETLQDLDT